MHKSKVRDLSPTHHLAPHVGTESNAQLKKADTTSLFSTASSNEGDRESYGLPLRTGDRQSAPPRAEEASENR